MTSKLALVAALALAIGGVAQAADGIDPVEVRQTAMDLEAGTVAGIKAVLAANGDVRTLEFPGKAIQRWGKTTLTLFPPGSDTGASKASPAIWSDSAGFQKAGLALSTAGEMLATAAKAGDATAAAAAYKSIGEACGGCHREYKLK
jgi:cytochrome c556